MPVVPNLGKSLTTYAVAAVLSLFCLAWIMQWWQLDWAVPFTYHWDSLSSGMLVKGLIDNPWCLHNPFVGMPSGQYLHDYPMPDNLHFLAIKLIALLAHDYAHTLNCYFVLGFPLTTLAALYVMRHGGVSFVPALAGSLLYTFLPYHFVREYGGHLFLGSYCLVPLMVMVVLWVFQERLSAGMCPERESTSGCTWPRRRWMTAVVICLLVASAGAYYAIFSCFFLLVAAGSACCYRRRWMPLAAGAILVTVLAVGLLVNLLPNIVYRLKCGANPAVATRGAHEAEIGALKIINLLLPMPGHRLRWLANIRATYDKAPRPAVIESDTMPLGIIGSAGFLFLLARLLNRKPNGHGVKLLDALAVLNIFAVLLGTLGGLGSAISVAGLTTIRCYNRVSIFIAFFSILAIVVLLDRAWRHCRSATARAFAGAGALVVTLGGLLDQTTGAFAAAPLWYRTDFLQDRAFVSRIEAAMPTGALIFQLPYLAFPENGTQGSIGDYDAFRPYLHSKSLRWSYGALKGRWGDSWQRDVVARPMPEMVAALADAGFRGIYLDRFGYADHAQRMESDLAGLLGADVQVSPNQRFTFISMEPYNRRRQAAMANSSRRQLADLASATPSHH